VPVPWSRRPAAGKKGRAQRVPLRQPMNSAAYPARDGENIQVFALTAAAQGPTPTPTATAATHRHDNPSDPPKTSLARIPNRPRATYCRLRSVVPFRALAPEILLHLLGMIAAVRLIGSINQPEPEVSGMVCAAFH